MMVFVRVSNVHVSVRKKYSARVAVIAVGKIIGNVAIVIVGFLVLRSLLAQPHPEGAEGGAQQRAGRFGQSVNQTRTQILPRRFERSRQMHGRPEIAAGFREKTSSGCGNQSRYFRDKPI